MHQARICRCDFRAIWKQIRQAVDQTLAHCRTDSLIPAAAVDGNRYILQYSLFARLRRPLMAPEHPGVHLFLRDIFPDRSLLRAL